MTDLPTWLEERLRCPETGVALVREVRAGRSVFVAQSTDGVERVYAIDNGVPVLLPGQGVAAAE